MPAPATLIGPLDFTQPIRWGCPLVEEPAEGWDTLKEKLILPDAGWLTKGMERPAPAGMAGRFFVQDVSIVEWVAGFPVADVVSRGLANNKPGKWSFQQQASEDTSLVWSNLTAYRFSAPRVVRRWISLEIIPSALDFVGSSLIPDETFGHDRTAYTYSAAYPEWTAYGWLGEQRQVEALVGCKTCLVTDSYLKDLGYDRTDQTDGLPAP